MIWWLFKQISLFILMIILSYVGFYALEMNIVWYEPASFIIAALVVVYYSYQLQRELKQPAKNILKRCFYILCIFCTLSVSGNILYNRYDKHITIDFADPESMVYYYTPHSANNELLTLDEPSSLTLPESALPRIDGSIALLPVYGAFLQAVTAPADYSINRRIDEGSHALSYTNTQGAYESLIKGNRDLIFVPQPSTKWSEAAKEAQVDLIQVPIGREGFVFFVNKDNPVDSLSTEQIKAIYSGKITNWQEVGGKNEPIKAFQRNEGSGSQTIMRVFMGDTPLMESQIETIVGLMHTIVRNVAYRNSTDAIGYSFRYYANDMLKMNNVKLLRINGIEPTVDNIRIGSYPLTYNFYAVYTPASKNIEPLLSWILGPQGQAIIEKVGYVPLH